MMRSSFGVGRLCSLICNLSSLLLQKKFSNLPSNKPQFMLTCLEITRLIFLHQFVYIFLSAGKVYEGT